MLRQKCLLYYSELPLEQQLPFREKVLMVHLKTYNDNTAVRKLLALATADVVLQSLAGKDLDSFTEHRWDAPIANLILVLGKAQACDVHAVLTTPPLPPSIPILRMS